jgi:DNA invertase Pin-like site-specific DNA recombinase
MAKIGYARVSTADQQLEPQIDELTAAGCDRIFHEKVSGAKAERPELDAALAYLREGDVLVVVKLDRLGRSVQHLVDTMLDLQQRGCGFRAITQGIDSTTTVGKLVFHIFAAIAEFERELIRERTNAGLAAAAKRGRHGGRRPSMSDEKVTVARQMKESGEHTAQTIAETLGVSRATVYRYL